MLLKLKETDLLTNSINSMKIFSEKEILTGSNINNQHKYQ